MVSALLIVTVALCGYGADRPALTARVLSELDHERAFLLWKIRDAAATQMMLGVCVEKKASPELASICNDAARERKLETEIASGYLSLFYGENAPSEHGVPGSLADRSQIPIKFLKQMIRQDRQGLKRAQGCLKRASRSEIRNFCHLVERSRSLEIQLLENQLCQLETNCRSKPAKR